MAEDRGPDAWAAHFERLAPDAALAAARQPWSLACEDQSILQALLRADAGPDGRSVPYVRVYRGALACLFNYAESANIKQILRPACGRDGTNLEARVAAVQDLAAQVRARHYAPAAPDARAPGAPEPR